MFKLEATTHFTEISTSRSGELNREVADPEPPVWPDRSALKGTM
jgi:hypothetical protein